MNRCATFGFTQGYLVIEVAVFLEFLLSLLRIGFLPQSRQGREGTQSRDDEGFLSEAKRGGAVAAEWFAKMKVKLSVSLRGLSASAFRSNLNTPFTTASRSFATLAALR
ncbi:MAG: hypothetical protein QM627_13725 [Luteolibacter sp.]